MNREIGAVTADPVHVVVGPAEHGITRHAVQLLESGDEPYLRLVPGRTNVADGLATLLAEVPPVRGLHLYLNDTMLGDETPAIVHRLGNERPVTLTLHDLPDPREGNARYHRRAHAYTEMWAAAVGVVLASEHERHLLQQAARHAGSDPASLAPTWVVPLPLTLPARTPQLNEPLEPVVAVLGFLYPGKGHEQAITVASALGLRGVVALGAVSPGHQELADELRQRAGANGLSWEVTGFLDEDELLLRARRVAVPLAWHAHLSASGSIGSWLQAGRQPVVAAGCWTEELAARCPGSVTIVPSEDKLVPTVAWVLAEPSLTVLSPGIVLQPTAAQAWMATRDATQRVHAMRGADR